MVDYNQSLSVLAAVKRGRTQALMVKACTGQKNRRLPMLCWSRPDQEQGQDAHPYGRGLMWPHEMARFLTAGASDFGMPDAMKMGGITGWLRAASIADTAGLPLSSHLFPEISAHLSSAGVFTNLSLAGVRGLG